MSVSRLVPLARASDAERAGVVINAVGHRGDLGVLPGIEPANLGEGEVL